jgi:hypothetical protein
MKVYVRHHSTSIPFRHFRGDVGREFLQYGLTTLHGTLGSHLRAVNGGCARAEGIIRFPCPILVDGFALCSCLA